jgi:hypothetical protein
MPTVRSLRWPNLRNRRGLPEIDLGGGRHLPAEDVLEGHFRRLASTPASQEIQVQVTPNLNAAIRVVAPQLAPLTQIAEELATTFPSVRPTEEFRRDLQRALEMAHRQQHAQRTLGTLPATEDTADSHWLWWLVLTAGLLIVAMVGLGLRQRRRQLS